MFENIGEKIKGWAVINFVFGVIGSLIGGIYVMSLSEDADTPLLILLGLLVIVTGIVMSYIASIFLYGFGELITTNQIIAKQNNESVPKEQKIATQTYNENLPGQGINEKNSKVATCEICDKVKQDLRKVVIQDNMGKRYRWACEECAKLPNTKIIATQNNESIPNESETKARTTVNHNINGKSITENSQSPQMRRNEVITLGHYPQSEEGNDYTTIEWLVLAKGGGKALLISKYALDSWPYNNVNAEVTWENCSLRNWLNDYFFNRAFSEKEQTKILPFCDGTEDCVFILNREETLTYFHDAIDRMCKPTKYAIAVGAAPHPVTRNCWWWLRSSDEAKSETDMVLSHGNVSYQGITVIEEGGGVRPAIWIKTDS